MYLNVSKLCSETTCENSELEPVQHKDKMNSTKLLLIYVIFSHCYRQNIYYTANTISAKIKGYV